MGILKKIFGLVQNTQTIETPQSHEEDIVSETSGTFQVEDMFEFPGKGVVLVGTVMSGAIAIGFILKDIEKDIRVAGIECKKTQLRVARMGEQVGILISPKIDISKNHLLEFFNK